MKEDSRVATLVDCEGRIYCEMPEQAFTHMGRASWTMWRPAYDTIRGIIRFNPISS